MLDTSKIYTSGNHGDFKIIKYISYKNVEIEFLKTGYRTTTQCELIRIGNIKDYLSPSVYGVGYIGIGSHKSRVNNIISYKYSVWASMIQRCYCPKSLKIHPTYIGCTVCKEWHNFQNFADWFDKNYTEGFELDKDIIVKGNKWYSPLTCKFVSVTDNVVEAHAKHYNFMSPDSIVFKIYNLRNFCRENGLDQSTMVRVHKGKSKHHKGWVKHNG